MPYPSEEPVELSLFSLTIAIILFVIFLYTFRLLINYFNVLNTNVDIWQVFKIHILGVVAMLPIAIANHYLLTRS